TFGNAYYPQDLVISLRRGERNLRLKPRRTAPSPSWVYSPKAAPDMRSVLFFMTELPPELIELCQGGPLEELEVRLKSREGAQTFAVSHAAISPRICG
ncbi:hypothetical protein IT087_03625, partial [Candidatus Uhrbacteria bacterium]|nr:hypothetical protein [Candidatus Uhrbacteria bacterium]